MASILADIWPVAASNNKQGVLLIVENHTEDPSVVTERTRTDVDFICRTTGCHPVAHADQLSSEKLGSAEQVAYIWMEGASPKVTDFTGLRILCFRCIPAELSEQLIRENNKNRQQEEDDDNLVIDLEFFAKQLEIKDGQYSNNKHNNHRRHHVSAFAASLGLTCSLTRSLQAYINKHNIVNNSLWDVVALFPRQGATTAASIQNL